MKKLAIYSITSILVIVASLALLVGCGTTNTAEAKYWFSSYEKNTVKYDDASDMKVEDAGTTWTMVVKKDMDVDILARMDVDDMYTTATLYLNGEQIKREIPDNIFNVVFKGLKLKKGDKLELKAFAVYALKATEHNDGYNISDFCIVYEGSNYVVEDIK